MKEWQEERSRKQEENHRGDRSEWVQQKAKERV